MKLFDCLIDHVANRVLDRMEERSPLRVSNLHVINTANQGDTFAERHPHLFKDQKRA